MRIGVFGGTFNPVHNAHLRVAEEAVERLDLDCVNLVLSADPPHKCASHIPPVGVRWKLLTLACEDNEKLIPCSIEIERPGPSYTVDTLRELRKSLSEKDKVFLLIGMDCAKEIETWKSWQAILEMAQVVVLTRGVDREELVPEPLRGRVQVCDVTRFDISSTDIRNRVREGKSIRYLVPPLVHDWILEYGVYSGEGSPEMLPVCVHRTEKTKG